MTAFFACYRLSKQNLLATLALVGGSPSWGTPVTILGAR